VRRQGKGHAISHQPGKVEFEVFSPHSATVGESPYWSQREGALYWVDIVGKRLLRRCFAASAETESWVFDDLVCAVAERRHAPGVVLAQRHALTYFDPADDAQEVFLGFGALGETIRANDGRCDPAGRFWLGTMQNNIAADGTPQPLTDRSGHLYSVTANGVMADHLDGIGIPNGLAWSPDGMTLYLADTVDERIDAFAFDPDTGTLGDRRVLVAPGDPGGPDGASVDVDGCLWVARWGGGCLIRYTPDGRVDRGLELPIRNPSACAFGGSDHRTLFVTSATFDLRPDQRHPSELDGAVLAVDVGVEGIPAHAFAD